MKMGKRNTVLYVSDNSLLYYRFGKLYYESGGCVISCVLQKSSLKRCVSRIRLIERLLRLSPRTSIKLDDNHFLISYNGNVYNWDVVQNNLQIEHAFRSEMNNPLSFTRIKGVAGFEDCIAYGEYFVNPTRKPVNVWLRNVSGEWKSVYQFNGNIIHVHGIVSDINNGCVYILTGDFGEEAAIWIAKDNFKIIVPLCKGEQKYRGCVGFPTNQGLLYATDAPNEPNALYLLNHGGEVNKVMDMPGPSIYGMENNGVYYFATSVEPDSSLPTWKYFLSRKHGLGIKDNYTHVIAGNFEKGFREIAKYEKDFWPLTLFQFANVLFPESALKDTICLMPVSVKRYDNIPIVMSVVE